MQNSLEVFVEAAELAVFARKKLSFEAATAARLPGRFESFGVAGLRANIATADQYSFLNTIEGVTEQSAADLSDVVKWFPVPSRITVVSTSPSQNLCDWLRGEGYAPVPVRPIAFLPISPDCNQAGTGVARWRIREVFTTGEMTLFMNLLEGGYGPLRDVGALIRTEHALPSIRRFIASRNNQPLAAAAMSLHITGTVLGGAATLPAARGSGAQTSLLSHRLCLAAERGVSLAAATAAPESPSISNLARLGFTIVERTAWRLAR